MAFKAPKKCPCGNGLYRKCCGRFHPQFAGEAAAAPASAEQLMRSRYSAFALGLSDYLLATWHVSTRPESLDLSDSPKWLQLDIYSAEQQGNAAQVHFCAYFQFDSEVGEHEELSEFVREDGRWFYLKSLQSAA
ncbi:YchJ family protein [Pseudidiomarina insulisalsae]|uniref:YchJ-like middle NTF2-like domain-containing protein n=1 Tax=Pseudidiomarina insulisalsae TaxID=575789 RepID=A0A432YML1_9GAMM|nr:YchJ family metal-binding protein [Pseudidiomarina insulisalsae]RUO62190.1 hypothetical protein CWI71_04890 [Pseudidiomarina insulisalsae]